MKSLIILGASLAAASPALARDEAGAENDAATEIVVTATGHELPIDQSGQAVGVIGMGEIQSIQGPDLSRVLERLPGVVYSRNGGPGGFTGVRVRGAEAEQLLVLVDGVRMDDPSQPSGGTNFGNLLAGNIGKVELLRGSNSVVWGSQAIGGVMALSTRQLEGADLSAEYGSYRSFTGTAAIGGQSERASGTLAAGYAHSRGFSEVAGDSEVDGYRQWEVTGKGKLELGGGFALAALGRLADSRRDVDGLGQTATDVQFTRDASARTGITYTGDTLDLTAGAALFDIRRHYEGPVLGALFFRGRTWRADFDGRWKATPELSLVFGASNDWTRFADGATDRKTARQFAAHALLDYHAGPANLSAGLRYDHHDTFGAAWTTGVNGSYEVAPGLRLRASYGEGFKTPTLYQLNAFGVDYGFVFSGNPDLKPERSRSYDAGIEYGDRNGALHFAVTLFRRDSRNLITFVGCDTSTIGICASYPGDYNAGTYANIGRARASGVEVEGDVRPVERVTLHVAYGYTKSYNRTPGDYFEGRDLARRPRHALTLAADWRTPLRDLTIGADLRVVSSSYDSQFSNLKLDGYALVTLRASLPVSERFEVFGRIENLGGENYQTAAGFNTPGRSAYAGVRARF